MTRRVRWIGDPSPWDDPQLLKGLVQATIPDALLQQFRRYENHQRMCVVPGQSELTLGPAHGFSRTYRFGPRLFEVEMDDADAERLFANEWDRWQFLDVTDVPGTDGRPRLTKAQWQALLASFGKLNGARKLARA